MRLISIQLQNYRLHRQCELEFGPALTLIGGPNESGKSTIAEAVFHALFLRSRRTGADRDKMVSTLGGHPEVRLVFEEAGETYTVRKSFQGVKGSTVLTAAGGGTWKGDEAEEKILSLCGLEGHAGKTVPGQWQHLWVWQGQSALDPVGFATERHQDLIARLQNQGTSAIFQSALDSAVAESVRKELEQWMTSRGPRAGSELDVAGRLLESAKLARQRAEDVAAKLDGAVRDFEESTRQLDLYGKILAELEAGLIEARRRLMEVTVLRDREQKELAVWESARTARAALAAGDAAIRAVSDQIAADSAALEPRESALAVSREAEKRAKAGVLAAETARTKAMQEVRTARLRLDVAGLWVKRFEAANQVAGLQSKIEEVKRLREQLARLPAIHPENLKKLQQLERNHDKMAGALAAISTQVEILDSELAVEVDGRKVAVGEKLDFTQDTEIIIGKKTRLKITPGGGSSLGVTRQRLAEAAAARQALMDDLGVSSPAEAAAACSRRTELLVRLEGSDVIDRQAAEAGSVLLGVDEEIARRPVPDFPPPTDWEASLAARAECLVRYEAAMAAESAAAAACQLATKDLEAAVAASAALATECQATTTSLAGLKGRLAELSAMHGDDTVRPTKLAQLAANESAAETALQATRATLKSLQPERWEAEEKRLIRSIEETRKLRDDADRKLAVSRNLLQQENATDPQGDLAIARAAERFAGARLGSASLYARALKLLDQYFQEEQKALTDQLTRPLAGKVSDYLCCVFGPGAGVKVSYQDGSFESLTLLRAGSASFDFGVLSGGTREQTAVAFRLAMAEILAEAHGGCLPVFLDDSFGNSDSDRVPGLIRMLDLAASRGLQIIVISCTPSDYAALGARMVILRGHQMV
ncbi:MAG: AAA family ATPase [Terrimicrobiaceae bacterium]